MELLQLLGISIVLLAFVFIAFAIQIIFKKNGRFSGGSCRSIPSNGKDEIGCGCGRNSGTCNQS